MDGRTDSRAAGRPGLTKRNPIIRSHACMHARIYSTCTSQQVRAHAGSRGRMRTLSSTASLRFSYHYWHSHRTTLYRLYPLSPIKLGHLAPSTHSPPLTVIDAHRPAGGARYGLRCAWGVRRVVAVEHGRKDVDPRGEMPGILDHQLAGVPSIVSLLDRSQRDRRQGRHRGIDQRRVTPSSHHALLGRCCTLLYCAGRRDREMSDETRGDIRRARAAESKHGSRPAGR